MERRTKLLALLCTLALMLSLTACTRTDLSPVDAGAAMLLEAVPEPSYGPVGGEWVAFGLARWGGEVPAAWFEEYYAKVQAHVKDCGGVLNERKYTEYSRVILALTAIGKDPRNVGGYNLLIRLGDFDRTVQQGINGAAYALLALDSGNYEIPGSPDAATQATREAYVAYLLEQALPAGGWTLSGEEADIDVTAIVLQALAKYREQQPVAEAVEKALVILADRQNEQGGYTAYDTRSSESVAQVIVALTELGISPEDPRFVKNENTLEDCLLSFRLADGTFCHVAQGKTDWVATQQAFYALVAIHRFQQGETSLYAMSAQEKKA